MSKLKYEKQLEVILQKLGLRFEREYRFAPPRRWRADFYLPDCNTLIEVEGGIFTRGRHTRAIGYTLDVEKYNTAQLMGYTILRFTTVHFGRRIRVLMDTLNELKKRCR